MIRAFGFAQTAAQSGGLECEYIHVCVCVCLCVHACMPVWLPVPVQRVNRTESDQMAPTASIASRRSLIVVACVESFRSSDSRTSCEGGGGNEGQWARKEDGG